MLHMCVARPSAENLRIGCSLAKVKGGKQEYDAIYCELGDGVGGESCFGTLGSHDFGKSLMDGGVSDRTLPPVKSLLNLPLPAFIAFASICRRSRGTSANVSDESY